MISEECEMKITQSDVLEVIQKAIEIMTRTLAQGDHVVLRNFGTFYVSEVKAKVGRNPKKPGQDIPIPARTVVKFKVGKELKDKVAQIQ